MWTVEPSWAIPGLFNVYDEDGSRIARNLTENRARLIAKAPERLEALKALLNDAQCVLESAEADPTASMVAVDMQDLGRMRLSAETASSLIAELESE